MERCAIYCSLLGVVSFVVLVERSQLCVVCLQCGSVHQSAVSSNNFNWLQNYGHSIQLRRAGKTYWIYVNMWNIDPQIQRDSVGSMYIGQIHVLPHLLGTPAEGISLTRGPQQCNELCEDIPKRDVCYLM